MVADRHRHAAYHILETSCLEKLTSMTLNDLELLKYGVLLNFSRSWAAIRISRVNCAEMAGDRPRQPAYKIFSTECRF